MATSAIHPAFLDPALLAGIEDLHLLARTVVDGFLEGMHVHPIARAGTAFRQYRPYEPGDDPRLLDWKMYARSDRFYIRETETESNVHLRFLLDTSQSMAHADPDQLSKFEYARMLVAAITYIAHRQGDGFTGLSLNDQLMVAMPTGKSGLYGFLDDLQHLKTGGVWPSWPKWSRLVGPLRRRELMIIFTDFYEHEREMRAALQHLVGMGREIMAIHLTTRKERDFSYRGKVAFEDLETSETVLVAADQIRDHYQADMRKMSQSLQREFGALGVDYLEWCTDEPLATGLRRYLMRRLEMP